MNRPVNAALKLLSGVSERCPVCRCARARQAGFAFRIVKTFEGICPFCRAYDRVHGRKSHEPVPKTTGSE